MALKAISFSSDFLDFGLQVLGQEAHEGLYFPLGTLPVLPGKGVQGQDRDAYFPTGSDGLANGFHPGLVPGYAGQGTLLGPAAVAVHDDGNVSGQVFRIEDWQEGLPLSEHGQNRSKLQDLFLFLLADLIDPFNSFVGDLLDLILRFKEGVFGNGLFLFKVFQRFVGLPPQVPSKRLGLLRPSSWSL